MSEETTTDSLIRVVVVDDHDEVREGIRQRIESNDAMTVVGEAADATAAFAQIALYLPDVVVLDNQLGDSRGLDLCGPIKEASSRTRCILYTATHADEVEAIRAGAAAVVLKQLAGDQLIATIEEVMTRGSPSA